MIVKEIALYLIHGTDTVDPAHSATGSGRPGRLPSASVAPPPQPLPFHPLTV